MSSVRQLDTVQGRQLSPKTTITGPSLLNLHCRSNALRAVDTISASLSASILIPLTHVATVYSPPELYDTVLNVSGPHPLFFDCESNSALVVPAPICRALPRDPRHALPRQSSHGRHQPRTVASYIRRRRRLFIDIGASFLDPNPGLGGRMMQLNRIQWTHPVTPRPAIRICPRRGPPMIFDAFSPIPSSYPSLFLQRIAHYASREGFSVAKSAPSSQPPAVPRPWLVRPHPHPLLSLPLLRRAP